MSYGPTELPRTTTGNSPFRLTYGTNALISVEQISRFKDLYNVEGLRLNLDLLDKVLDFAMLRLAVYQQRTARHYNQKVRQQKFEVGDLVLREVEAFTPQNTRKLMPNEFIGVPKPETYRLRTIDGVEVKNTWSGRLRKYH